MPRMASPSRSGSTSNVMNRQSKPPLLERLLDEVLRGVPRRRVGDEATFFDERSAGHGDLIKPRPPVAEIS